jgi:hypothetical protein
MHLKNFVNISSEIATTQKVPKGIGACGYCSEQLELFDIFGPNCPYHNILTNKYVCDDCSRLFSDYFRKNHFYIIKNEIKLVSQSELADILRNVELPCILSYTESNKIGRLPLCKINYDRNKFIIRTDKLDVELDLDTDIDLMNFLESLYNSYKLSKEWIITGEIPTQIILSMGLDLYQEYLTKTNPIRGNPKLNVLVAFINGNEAKKSKFK